MENEVKYRILIIDDNPFPTRECCKVLIEKFCNRFNNPLHPLFDKLYNIYFHDHNELSTYYPKTRGKSETFLFGNSATLTVYNYNPVILKDNTYNQQEIIKLIKSQRINIVWTDRGHSDFEIKCDNLYEINSENNTTADELYKNEAIINALIANKVMQVAMYSFNSTLTHRHTDKLKKEIHSYFKNQNHEVFVDILETSAVFNFFGKNNWLSAGTEKDKFLGTTTAYRYYGHLLGNILFDLFLQLPENKVKLTEAERRYNFFNPANREFLRFYKLLNSDLTNKLSDFKIGMVSFYTEIFGRPEYIIDVPYKEYYEKYDDEIKKGTPPIETLIQPHPNSKKEEWLYFKYKQNDNNDFQFNYTLCHSRNPFNNLVESYLPLLHTGIFYAPNFYNTGNSLPKFSLNPDSSSYTEEDNCIEVLYLLKNERFEDSESSPIINKGVSHLVVWRWINQDNGLKNRNQIEVVVEALWERYYRLIEPKLKGTLVGLFQRETKRLATKAAETKILSRNFSHHIGSHVMPNVSLKQIRERYQELCGTNISEDYLDFLKTKLDTYITERNEFLSNPDGSLKPVLFYSQIIVPFIENFLLTDNLCRSEGLGFRKARGCDIEIEVLINGVPITASFGANVYPNVFYDSLSGNDNSGAFQSVPASINGNDLPIAVSNIHAIFSILENFIRNTAKHQKDKFEIDNKTLSPKLPLKVFLNLKQDKDDIHSFWLTISDNVSTVAEGFEANDPEIIDNNNAVAQSHLGIIDFKICAGLLNKKPYEQVDTSIFIINRGIDARLSYSFKILKPKDICLIGYTKSPSFNHPTFDYYKTAKDFLGTKRSPAPYQFYLIKETELKSLLGYSDHIKHLPFRLLVEKEIQITEDQSTYFEENIYGRKYLVTPAINLTLNSDEILEQCWTQWLKRWGNTKKELVVYSEVKLDGWYSSFKGTDALDFQFEYAKPITALSSNYPKVFYDHHGGGISNTGFPAEHSFLSSNAYIAFGKNSKDNAVIRNSKPVVGEKWLLPFWLTEAGLSKILIMDERVLDLASKIYNHKSSKDILLTRGKFWYSKYTNQFKSDKENWWSKEQSKKLHNIDSYWASNIFVATHLNGNPIKEALFKESDDHWVKVNIDTHLSMSTNFDYLTCENSKVSDFTNEACFTDFDAIIIHRTFLNDQSLKTFWSGRTSTEVLDILNKHFPLVLITSGGGDVITYEGNFKFISINEILSCISAPECIGKQVLTNILFTK